MLSSPDYDAEAAIACLNPAVFGIDLHWLPHAQEPWSRPDRQAAHPMTPGAGRPLVLVLPPGAHPVALRDFVLRGDSTEEPMRRLVREAPLGRRARRDPQPDLEARRRVRDREPVQLRARRARRRLDPRHLLRCPLRLQVRQPCGCRPVHGLARVPDHGALDLARLLDGVRLVRRLAVIVPDDLQPAAAGLPVTPRGSRATSGGLAGSAVDRSSSFTTCASRGRSGWIVFWSCSPRSGRRTRS